MHRDLALRNLLITVSSEGYLVKISDFGMSRALEKDYYKSESKTIPVKWSPPEVIDSGNFTLKSDVWSFVSFLFFYYVFFSNMKFKFDYKGVVLWELFSLG